MSIISLSNWMDLPGYSLSNWTNNQPLPARLPSKFILEYFRAYAKHMGVEKNFMENTTVTNVSVSFLKHHLFYLFIGLESITGRDSRSMLVGSGIWCQRHSFFDFVQESCVGVGPQ